MSTFEEDRQIVDLSLTTDYQVSQSIKSHSSNGKDIVHNEPDQPLGKAIGLFSGVTIRDAGKGNPDSFQENGHYDNEQINLGVKIKRQEESENPVACGASIYASQKNVVEAEDNIAGPYDNKQIDLPNVKRKNWDYEGASPPNKVYKAEDKTDNTTKKIGEFVKYHQMCIKEPGKHGSPPQPFSFDQEAQDSSLMSDVDSFVKGQKKTIQCGREHGFFLKKVQHQKFHLNEVLVPLRLNHKNIVKIVQAVSYPMEIVIVMKYAGIPLDHIGSNLALRNYIHSNLVDFYASLVKVIVFLNNQGISLNDIKPANICCRGEESGFKPVFIDLESSRTSHDDQESNPKWTPEFAPPCIVKRMINYCQPTANEFMKNTADFYAISISMVVALNDGKHPIFSTKDFPNKRPDLSDIESINKYCRQLSDTINENWMMETLRNCSPLTEHKDCRSFIHCFRTNIMIDRGQWDINPTIKFLEEWELSKKSNFGVTNRVDPRAMKPPVQTLKKLGQPSSRSTINDSAMRSKSSCRPTIDGRDQVSGIKLKPPQAQRMSQMPGPSCHEDDVSMQDWYPQMAHSRPTAKEHLGQTTQQGNGCYKADCWTPTAQKAPGVPIIGGKTSNPAFVTPLQQTPTQQRKPIVQVIRVKSSNSGFSTPLQQTLTPRQNPPVQEMSQQNQHELDDFKIRERADLLSLKSDLG